MNSWIDVACVGLIVGSALYFLWRRRRHKASGCASGCACAPRTVPVAGRRQP